MENCRSQVLHSSELQQEQRGIKFNVEVLNIKPCEFGPLYDKFHKDWLQRAFSRDAGRLGTNFAVEHYKKYAQFTQDWVNKCSSEIAKWASFYKPKK